MSIRKIRKTKRKIYIPYNYSLTKAILDILIDVSEHITLFASPYDKLRLSWKREWGMPKPPWWRYNRAIKYLEQRGQIEIRQENDEVFVRLTQKGKVEALLNRLQAIGNFGRRSWDGKYRLIIWDIPESSRLQRDQIRWFVKHLGFFQLQRSVFIIPYPLPTEAVKYLKESGLYRYIRFLRVDKIDDDQWLRKHFGLDKHHR